MASINIAVVPPPSGPRCDFCSYPDVYAVHTCDDFVKRYSDGFKFMFYDTIEGESLSFPQAHLVNPGSGRRSCLLQSVRTWGFATFANWQRDQSRYRTDAPSLHRIGPQAV